MRYQYYKSTVSLQPGQEYAINLNDGQLLFLWVSSNNPSAIVGIVLEDEQGGVLDLSMSYSDLYSLGFTSPSQTPYITRYDTTNNVYVMTYAPSSSPRYSRLKLYVRAPQSSPIVASLFLAVIQA